MLTQYEFQPRRLVFYIYLGLLAIAAFITSFTRETVEQKAEHVSLRPRVGVPPDKRKEFISPAATGFCVFAVLGLFTALAPTLLSQQLHEKSHALAGALVFEIYGFGALTAILFHAMPSQRAMWIGECVIFLHLALLLVAVELHSLPVLLVAAAVGGVAIGFGFKGSLETVNLLAPPGQHSAMLSNFYLFTYLGLALPAIGVGIISQLAKPLVADLTFAALVAALAAIALVSGFKCRAQ